MKKLLTLILLAADIGLLIYILNSEPYSGGPAQASSLQGTESVQQTAQSSPASGYSKEEESPVMPESVQTAAPSDAPEDSGGQPGAWQEPAEDSEEGSGGNSFDSFLLGDSGNGASEDGSGESGQEPAGQETEDGSGDYSQGMDDGGEELYEEAAEPAVEDFGWYGPDVDNWPPEGAEMFTDYGRMKGGWKAYINFDPDNSEGRRLDILLYVNISGGEEDVSVECDWYWNHDLNTDESWYDEDESSYYYGNYDEGEIFASGAGSMRIRYFYERNGTEYAIGTMESRAGVEAILCMMR